MAKKSRTPAPPKRVQAPRKRHEPRDPQRTRMAVLYGAGALVLVAAAVGAYLLFGTGESAAATLRGAGCTVETAPAQGRQHVDTPPKTKYNTFPPTTGPHFGTPAPHDVYLEPVEQFRLVHNLEHGAVVIQYGEDVPDATVERIVQWYREDPNGILVAPLPALEDRIALGAWVSPEAAPGEEPGAGRGVVAKCGQFDERAFDAFVDEYGFRGPERFEREDLAPGS